MKCTRTATALRIEVDNVRGREQPMPAHVRIESAHSFRVGGNSTEQTNDQFSGAIDNVFFRLEGP